MNKEWQEKLDANYTELKKDRLDEMLTAKGMWGKAYERFIREVVIPEAFEAGIDRGMEIGRKFQGVESKSAPYETTGQDQFIKEKLGE